MWRAVVLAVCVMALGVRGTEGPSYGVKLCGREFIRAVIFTCGGSRWRRSLVSAEEEDVFGALKDRSDEGWEIHPSLQVEPSSGVPRAVRPLVFAEILEALRRDDRKGRGVVVGLSNACCKWGCSKSEISSLC